MVLPGAPPGRGTAQTPAGCSVDFGVTRWLTADGSLVQEERLVVAGRRRDPGPPDSRHGETKTHSQFGGDDGAVGNRGIAAPARRPGGRRGRKLGNCPAKAICPTLAAVETTGHG